MPHRLLAVPLATWERDGLKAALVKAGLAAHDIGEAGILFWRFETFEDIPVGFGGIEVHGSDALLRSLVTLPPLRQIGMGAAMIAALEIEARALKCQSVYVLTSALRDFFSRLGYSPCAPDAVPEQIRASGEFSRHGADGIALTKRLV
jgi:N-acetylglutamate synthase-like GNAT family acetyltransferase